MRKWGMSEMGRGKKEQFHTVGEFGELTDLLVVHYNLARIRAII